jgi:hypothetical protein
MTMELELILMTVLAGFAGLIGLHFMWIGHRFPARRRISHIAIDPLAGSQDYLAVYGPGGLFIPMPNHLKTRDEMVTWMTQELPKLTADMLNPRT